MRRSPILLLPPLLAALLCAACGPPTVRPASFPDPSVSCPGARAAWNLQIVDQRVSRGDEARVIGAVRDAIQKSFPGCRWSGPPDADAGTIEIEIHRFQSAAAQGSWEAAVEWSVSAHSPTGSRLTEFEANEEVSRPNYQGYDNEKEALSEAFRKAVERTTKGLTAIPVMGNLRPLQGTDEPRLAGLAQGPGRAVNAWSSEASGPAAKQPEGLERIWQCWSAEVL